MFDTETAGLAHGYYNVSEEFLRSHGFEMARYHEMANLRGDVAELEIYEDGKGLKIIILCVTQVTASEGDLLHMEGSWKISQFNGQKEFIFKTALLSVPEDPLALLHYACEITKGIGPAIEERIWTAYAAKWREHPELDGIVGANDSTRFHWQDTLKRLDEQAAQTQALAFLMSKGATLNMSSLAWDAWHEETISKVTADPFILADLPRYGFMDVDQGIRQAFGIGDDDPRRLDAAMLYCLNKLTETEGTATVHERLQNEVNTILPATDLQFNASIKRLIAAEKIVRITPTIAALKIDYQNEESIWKRFSLTKAS